MNWLGLEVTLNGLVRASGVRWYEYAVRGDSDDVLRRALVFKAVGKRRRG